MVVVKVSGLNTQTYLPLHSLESAMSFVTKLVILGIVTFPRVGNAVRKTNVLLWLRHPPLGVLDYILSTLSTKIGVIFTLIIACLPMNSFTFDSLERTTLLFVSLPFSILVTKYI